MRSGIYILATFLVAAFLTGAGVAAHADDSLDALINRAANAPIGERPGLYTEIAERELRAADQLYNAGKAEEARVALDNVVSYSDKASDATARSRGKTKNTEIAIRKMAAKLRDIKRSLAFEDQPPVQAAADHLEKLRTALLARMFDKEH